MVTSIIFINTQRNTITEVAVEGIRATETMLAFKAFSKHDLESMFTVGM